MTAEGERVKEAIAAAKEYIDTMKGLNPKFCDKLSVLKESASERDSMKRALDLSVSALKSINRSCPDKGAVIISGVALAEISKIMGEK